MTLDLIQKEVEKYFGLQEGAIYQKTRKREIVQARQIFTWFVFDSMKNDIDNIDIFERNINEEIAVLIGFDQATVRYSVKTIDGLAEFDKHIRKAIEEISLKLHLENITISTEEKKDAIILGLCELLTKK